ncbi:pyridoxal phosphate-dependent aminotransferase [Nonomuraea sp. KC401]|uniref:pyridoxal phosphate-dependent aminotransferase n=1 Tax=unclassified Nonomuraea TaxID=2593643 RepID=UPI0010FDB098|nr:MULTISPECIES: pyridoxal phosphate-dependent aminotransferase [unclassified Nonomuraea]NBE96574.1 aminotransferase class I/II-fold pyridoxal phosphate-dependent enzyme [Nonomuraea sp. K271]TLF86324.1 pyridoxal phosphate-dependent aminotransferase [Nonomuraea sp. KC401]
MTVSRLREIPGIGVDLLGDRADQENDDTLLRLENLDTDLRPPAVALETTKAAIDQDSANSYLPFQGGVTLRQAAAAHVGRMAGRRYDPARECVITAGGLNGVLNTLLATVEPGDEVVMADPIYAGLVNRVRLAGGVPRFVPLAASAGGWTLDPGELAAAVTRRTAVVLMMSPAMPTGSVLGPAHWEALSRALDGTPAWLLYDAAMERIRFDDAEPAHPARHEGLAARTITVGSASKELRMIGWRVGWVVGPETVMADVNLVGLSNVVCQVGLAQEAVAAALASPDADADVARAVDVWRGRCDTILDQLAGYPVIPPDGGWSLLVDTSQLGMSPAEASERLFTRGRVAATPMNGWGPSGDRHLRFVFANEPVERLRNLRSRVEAAWG